MSPRDAPVEVLLGPAIDLHPGIHGTFLESPPPGFSYAPTDGTHRFLFPGGSGYPQPFETPHWGELISFAASARAPLVHTARWPALGARAWVADMDDFGYPMLTGRTILNAAVRRRFAQDHRRPGGLAADHPIRHRLAHMLRGYAHPSCRAVLFRTRHALAEAARILAAMDAGADGETFLAKCEVLGPALAPIEPAQLAAKWSDAARTHVLFCGNDWRIKNGPLAIRVMARLAIRHPAARFVYLGLVPPESAALSLPPNLRLLGSVPREQARTFFAGAHILFHPARSESFGMVLLEAAAAGLAIVCGGGRGMQHLGEIVDGGGAAILDRHGVAEDDEEAGFEALLAGLLADRAAARAMAAHNRERIATTTLSLARRNAALAAVYHRAMDTAAAEGLREEDVVADRAVAVRRLRGDQVEAAERELRRRVGCDELNVVARLG